MPIVDYWKLAVLRRYATFNGRSNRPEYWWFTLGNAIVQLALYALVIVADGFVFLYVIFLLATFVPSVAVSVRRLHDTGRSGWWLLLSFVPCLGLIVLLIFAVSPGDPGSNEYGPPPRRIGV